MLSENQNVPSVVKADKLVERWRLTKGDALKVVKGEARLDYIKSNWYASELLEFEFPEAKWIVPGIVPEGLTILGGRPKVGKSWLILQILKGVALDGEIFGKSCQIRNCLYLALEDSPRRLKERLEIQGWTNTNNVTFLTRIPAKLDSQDGMKWLAETIDSNKFEFVVIDTISRALSRKTSQKDNDEINSVFDLIQKLSFAGDIPIVLIDHMNKSHKDSDFLDAVMGGTAKTGVADAILGLRKERNQFAATLEVTGRDVNETKLVLEWQPETCTYELLGNEDEVILDRSIIKLCKAVNELGNDATQKNICQHTGWKQSYLSKMLKEAIEQNVVVDNGYGKAYITTEMKMAEDSIEKYVNRDI